MNEKVEKKQIEYSTGCFKTVLYVVAIAVSLFVLYKLFFTSTRRINSIKKDLYRNVLDEQIRPDVVRNGSPGKLYILGFNGDRNQVIENNLRKSLRSSGKFEFYEASWVEKKLKEMGIQTEPEISREGAKQVGKATGFRQVILGEVKKHKFNKDSGALKVEYTMIQPSEEKIITSGIAESTINSGSFSYWQAQVLSISSGVRLFLWLLLTFLLPFSYHPILKLFSTSTNQLVKLSVLLTGGFLSALIAFVLLGFSLSGFITALMLLLAFVAGFYYHAIIFAMIIAKIQGA